MIFVINFFSAYNFNVKESFDCTGELVQSRQSFPHKIKHNLQSVNITWSVFVRN